MRHSSEGLPEQEVVVFTCYICDTKAPIDFVNKHHKVPKSVGGRDTPDNLIELCPGCHQNMHVIARMMRNPKRVGEVKTALNTMFPGPKVQQRCMELAHLVIKGKVMASSDREAPDPDKDVKIGLTLRKSYRDALQLMARDRKMSMADYSRKIMEAHIRSVFPNLEGAD